jgi:hypothetical protein
VVDRWRLIEAWTVAAHGPYMALAGGFRLAFLATKPNGSSRSAPTSPPPASKASARQRCSRSSPAASRGCRWQPAPESVWTASDTPGCEQTLPTTSTRPDPAPTTGVAVRDRPATISARRPEILLLDQIAAGELDPHLTAIAEAIRARYELLQTIGSAKALAMLNIGDRVRVNHHASPRYLHGIHGTVVELDEHNATVCVHRPIGRFKSGEIRCSPLVLDRLNPAA